MQTNPEILKDHLELLPGSNVSGAIASPSLSSCRHIQLVSVRWSRRAVVANFLCGLENQFEVWAATTRYWRPIIHFAPTIIAQTATVAVVSTMTAASNAIDSSTPSSSI